MKKYEVRIIFKGEVNQTVEVYSLNPVEAQLKAVQEMDKSKVDFSKWDQYSFEYNELNK